MMTDRAWERIGWLLNLFVLVSLVAHVVVVLVVGHVGRWSALSGLVVTYMWAEEIGQRKAERKMGRRP